MITFNGIINPTCNIVVNFALIFNPKWVLCSSTQRAQDATLRSPRKRQLNEFLFPKESGLDFLTSPNSDDSGREADPFWPWQLQSLTPLTSIEGQRKGVHFAGQKRWFQYIFSFYTQNLQEIVTFVHAIFPDSACSKIQKNEVNQGNLGRGQKAMSHIAKKSDNKLVSLREWPKVTINWYQWASGSRLWQMKNSGARVPAIDSCHGVQNTTINW